MKTKKGIQLGEAFGAILAVVLVAVLIVIAIFLFVTLASSFTGASTVTVTNENPAWLNTTEYIVNAAGNCSFSNLAVTGMWNTTGGELIPAANYTVNAATGSIVNATTSTYPSIDTNLSYTYDWGSAACEASDDMVTEFASYPALIGLIGTIVLLGLVIGVLVGSFAFGGRRV